MTYPIDRTKWDDWDGEWCRRCGHPQRFAWIVDDTIWEAVVAQGWDTNKILCLECFFELADRAGIHVSEKDFVHLSIVSSRSDLVRPRFVDSYSRRDGE